MVFLLYQAPGNVREMSHYHGIVKTDK